MRLEDITAGMRLRGVLPSSEVEVIAATMIGLDAVLVVYRTGNADLGQQILVRAHEVALGSAPAISAAFDARADEFKLVAEALRIKMAGLYDPMVAVTTSDLEPLPHQIQAVYGELLPRVPLRFLLADDPGAGKTIMAGLYAKELLLRGDLARCLIVTPGGLVEQWQDELLEKFALRFELLTADLVAATPTGGNVFTDHPRLIAKMDQLARNDDLQAQLERTDWDLVVVDEAHRMSAHHFGREVKTTKRFELGRRLSSIARHFLLMTATPHAGKEEDFQLFLSLLDEDRFEGKYRKDIHALGTDGLMLRRIKEELLTFEGKRLFPKRVAHTVPFELSKLEHELYEQVTEYVRQEWNRVQKLKDLGEGRRGNTVGFALTVLQRRLASSPEAILRSLERRQQRLERRLRDVLSRPIVPADERRWEETLGDSEPAELDDVLDELSGEDREALEDEVVDAATAARTAEELRQEIAVLRRLVEVAGRVRSAGTDTKWVELRNLLQDNPDINGPDANPRKLIIFTEHKDTLNYLVGRIQTLLGKPDAVVHIHGGVGRQARRETQARFNADPTCLVLVATDAAGDGLNLQRAHLMINYDLPWNPNRIEQRFGRVHRIGQTNMCQLWNLLAKNTREGDVFLRLLAKVDEQAKAYQGKVFDVLGEAFEGVPLRTLLVEAIREGERPEVREYLNRVIDERAGDEVKRLLDERALLHDRFGEGDVERIREQMEEARARRLQPYYIEAFFRDAFDRLGGRLGPREAGRWQISHVPAAVRDRRVSTGPVAPAYERVCFDRARVRVDTAVQAELLAPGHPLLDAVVTETITRHEGVLKRGTILVDRLDAFEEPRLLVAVRQEITDAHEPPRSVARRFAYVELYADGRTRPGVAPYLDYQPAADDERALIAQVPAAPWLASAQTTAQTWAAEHELPPWLDEVASRRRQQVSRLRQLVQERLHQEINHWYAESTRLAGDVEAGKRVRISPQTAMRRAEDLERRLERRLGEIDRDAHLQARPPVVAALALVIPQGLVDRLAGRRDGPVESYAKDTAAVELRAVRAVVEAERRLGRDPETMPHNNPGYDLRSRLTGAESVFIEVKGRIAGADDFVVTNTEIRHGQNTADQYRLALVSVHPDGPERDEVRYVRHPYDGIAVTTLVDSVRIKWAKMWNTGEEPW